MLVITLLILQAVWSLWMFCKTWRYDFDVEVRDLIFFSVISLIPCMFILSTGVFLIRLAQDSKLFNRTILKKYAKNLDYKRYPRSPY